MATRMSPQWYDQAPEIIWNCILSRKILIFSEFLKTKDWVIKGIYGILMCSVGEGPAKAS